MEITQAALQDCRAVAEVHVASWQAAYEGILDAGFLASLSVDQREQAWRQAVTAGESELLVARVGGDIVGFASIGPSRDADAPAGRGEIWALYVHPGQWSTGAGRQLWAAARDRLLSNGHSSISLWVLERNTRAIRFYSAAGLVVERGSEKDFDLGGTRVREVRMATVQGLESLAGIPRFIPLDAGLATAGQPSEEQLALVARAGFSRVVNLGLHDDPSYALANEAATVHGLGMDYVHIPVQFSSPTLADLAKFSQAMAEAKGKVFVHCRHNKRVPVFVALDRIRRQGWEPEVAFAVMRAAWEPDETWRQFIDAARK